MAKGATGRLFSTPSSPVALPSDYEPARPANFEVARITNLKMYVPSDKERPVAELGYRRVRGELKALDAAITTSLTAAEKREARKNELMQAAFEANRALRAQIEAEIRN